MVARAFAAEFPNDNSELHAGTIWMSTEPCGPPVAHFAASQPEPEPGSVVEPEELPADPDEITEPIEIVESIELEGPVEVVPLPVEPEASTEAGTATPVQVEVHVEAEVAAVTPVEVEVPAAVAIERGPSVVALPVEFTEPEPLEERPEVSADDADDDPYAVFIRKLAEVAVASGATMDAASIDALLGTDAVASAWRAILRGESEDFSTCGGALDEWAATALASMMSAPHKIAQIRRELRARGVAAFGLIDAS